MLLCLDWSCSKEQIFGFFFFFHFSYLNRNLQKSIITKIYWALLRPARWIPFKRKHILTVLCTKLTCSVKVGEGEKEICSSIKKCCISLTEKVFDLMELVPNRSKGSDATYQLPNWKHLPIWECDKESLCSWKMRISTRSLARPASGVQNLKPKTPVHPTWCSSSS